MEPKDLKEIFNLKQYLIGHEGTYFYSNAVREVRYEGSTVNDEGIPKLRFTYIEDKQKHTIYTNVDGSLINNGPTIIWPSLLAFEANPTCPVSAWKEWLKNSGPTYELEININTCVIVEGKRTCLRYKPTQLFRFKSENEFNEAESKILSVMKECDNHT